MSQSAQSRCLFLSQHHQLSAAALAGRLSLLPKSTQFLFFSVDVFFLVASSCPVRAGKQRKLTAWLGGATSVEHVHTQLTGASQPPLPDPNDPHQSCITKISSSSTDLPATAEHLTAPTAQGIAQNSSSATPRAGAGFSRKASSSRTGARGSKAGQTNLRTFLQQRPAAVTTSATATTAKADASAKADAMSSTHMIQTATPAATAGVSPVTAVSHNPQISARSAEDESAVPSAFVDPVMPQQAGADLKHAEAAARQMSSDPALEHEAGLSQGISLASAPSQVAAADYSSRSSKSSQSDAFGSHSNSAADAGKAAVTAAWSKIQNKMKAPKCKGHGEDCVIREVKKNGLNKGVR